MNTNTISTPSTCDLCDYWEWRLKDMRLSRDKAADANITREIKGKPPEPMQGFYDDVSRVKHRLVSHRAIFHAGRAA